MVLGNPDRPVGGLSVPRPPGVEIRPLGRNDFIDALAMLRELYGLDLDADSQPHQATFETLVNDVDAAPFLALADGQPAGLILFRFRRRLNHATYEGWVSDFVVRTPFRGRGIGRALLAAVIAEWRLRGGHQVMLEVGYERTAARALYSATGFTDMGKFFEMAPVQPRGRTAPGVEVRQILDDDADFEAATRLLAELGRPAPIEEKLPALRRTYTQHTSRADTASMLAIREGVPLGFISLEFRQPFFVTAPQAWIPDLIVSEAARGRGIGAALLDSAFAEAQRHGAYAVVLESGHQRGVAHQLYGSSGMTDVGSFFTMPR